jgi:hypothetical protein
LIRFLVPVFLTVSAVSLLLLAPTGAIALIVGIGAVAAVARVAGSHSRAAVAWRWAPVGRLLYLLNTFLTINLAILQGWWNFVCGHRDVMWQHDRQLQ